MPINDPTYPGEAELHILTYSHVTSAYCNNVPLAFDDDPTTSANFPSQNQTLVAPTTGLPQAIVVGVSGTTGTYAGGSAGYAYTGGFTPNGTYIPVSGANALYNGVTQYTNGSCFITYYNGVWFIYTSVNFSGTELYSNNGGSGSIIESSGWSTSVGAGPAPTLALIMTGLPSELVCTNAALVNAGTGIGGATWLPISGVNAIATNATQYTNGTVYASLGSSWDISGSAGGSGGTLYQNGGGSVTVFPLTGWAIGSDATPVPTFTATYPAGNPPTPGSLLRYIHINFQTNLSVTRIRYLGDGQYAGITLDSGFSEINNNIGNNDNQVPLNSFIPLNVGGNVYDLQFSNPAYCAGVWILPDYLNPDDNYPSVDLSQFQIYYSTGFNNMPSGIVPTKTFVTLGAKSIQLAPWVASNSAPLNSAVSNFPLSIQSLDISRSSKVAEELGGEDVWLNGIYEYERRVTGKLSVSRVTMGFFALIMSGNLLVDNVGTSAEAQYYASLYNDVNPYFTLIGTSTEGDGAQTTILPKIKLSGSLSDVWDRTKLTVFDISFEAVWDTTWITQTGTVGAIQESYFRANGSTAPVTS